MSNALELKRNGLQRPAGPIALIVLDGVGIGRKDEGDAVYLARTPVMDTIRSRFMTTQLKAHGTAVGMPSDADMGNSEVGHNALGAGRVFDQGAKLVSKAISDGVLFEGATWKQLIEPCREGKRTLHLMGLLSDGNVHSHIDQVTAMLRECDKQGVLRVRLHVLLDGRDVPAQSSLEYVDKLEHVLGEINRDNARDYRIASGGGRMDVTMDRYEADWSIVERGWKTHVQGEAKQFGSAREAIEYFRGEKPTLNDQFIPPFVVADAGQPLGRIQDDDSVIFFNFRGDRAIEICRAFEDEQFDKFDRGQRPRVRFAGMMQYDGDLGIPSGYLVEPPQLKQTLGEYLSRNGVAQFACSETQKYGHVTYFFNGNRSGKFDDKLEDYCEITSDRVTFDQRPWMKAAEITDATISAMSQRDYGFMRINYPNGDMVGHTGDLEAAIISVEATDLCLGRLLSAIKDKGGIALVTADHGNADQMFLYNKDGSFRRDENGLRVACTAHSLNPVYFTFVDEGFDQAYALSDDIETPGLSNVAATAMTLLGFQPPENYDKSLIKLA